MRREAPTREWFRDWFGEDYLAVYPHRDEQEAAEAVALFIAASARTSPTGPVLDVACGEGRHLRELLAAGVSAVGLDLSIDLLERARGRDPAARLVRGDMRRLPLASGRFAGLTSFFTSFGYFAERDEDLAVAVEFRRVMRVGGAFMLDFLNAARVRGELVPEDERVVRGHRVTQRRRLEGDVVEKHIRIEDETGGKPARTFTERVRLYEPADLERLLESAGLHTERRFGDYAGGDFGPLSPRLILAGRAT